MKNCGTIERKLNKYLVYSILFVIMSCFIFTAIWIRKAGLIMMGDCYNEYYPILNYISEWYRNLIPGLINRNVKLFEWSIGYGDNIIGTLNWFGLGDIFLLPAAFCPSKLMPYMYSFITLLRIYLAGLFFIVFCEYKQYKQAVSVAAGLMYAFSFYMLGLGLIAFTFPTPAVYFPLLVMGVDKIKNNPRISIYPGVILVIFLQSLCGFYFLWIDLLTLFMFFIVSTVVNKCNIGKSLISFVNCVIHFTIGIGLAGTILFPAVNEYFQCVRASETKGAINPFECFEPSYIKQLFISIIDPAVSGYKEGAMIPVISVVLMLILISRRGYKQYKLVIFVLFYGYFFPFIGTVMNGGAYHINRWTYVLQFAVCVFTASLLPKMLEHIDQKCIVIAVASLIAYIIGSFILQDVSAESAVRSCGYIMLFVLALVILVLRVKDQINVSKAYTVMVVVLIINVAYNGFMFMAPVKIGGKGAAAGFLSAGYLRENINNSQLAKLKDNSCYSRIDFNDSALDAPLMLGKNTTFSYYSMYNGNLFRFHEKLRISPAMTDSYVLEGLDGRQVLESLLSVDKYAYAGSIIENQYFLPLGFTYSHETSEKSIEAMDPLSKMSIMVDSIVLEDSDESVKSSLCEQKAVPIKIFLNYQEISPSIHQILTEDDVIHIKVNDEKLNSIKCEYYLKLENVHSNADLWNDLFVDGKKIRIKSDENEPYLNQNYDYYVNVSDSICDGSIDIEVYNDGEYNIDGLELIKFYIPYYQKYMDDLKKDHLTDVVIANNSLNGSISVKSDKWLFLSIPYDKGWNCTIDGAKAQLVKANYGFMAVKVSPGVHKICMTYRTPGLAIGIFVSIFSLVLFIMMLVLHNKR